ncbi:MAG: peroxiredoxin family protein [Bacteroidales bacterium]|nr:peroxiredoxin family protein [Bacteroidales bacterium]MCF8404920.1 peroxiredoxin family protein [Bacteroidales bacterium]
MKKVLPIVAFVLFGFGVYAQTTLDTAQNFTVKDTYGNNIELFDILNQGKIVVIDFFSTA